MYIPPHSQTPGRWNTPSAHSFYLEKTQHDTCLGSVIISLAVKLSKPHGIETLLHHFTWKMKYTTSSFTISDRSTSLGLGSLLCVCPCVCVCVCVCSCVCDALTQVCIWWTRQACDIYYCALTLVAPSSLYSCVCVCVCVLLFLYWAQAPLHRPVTEKRIYALGRLFHLLCQKCVSLKPHWNEFSFHCSVPGNKKGGFQLLRSHWQRLPLPALLLKHIELISFRLWRRQSGFLLLTLCGQRLSLPALLLKPVELLSSFGGGDKVASISLVHVGRDYLYLRNFWNTLNCGFLLLTLCGQGQSLPALLLKPVELFSSFCGGDKVASFSLRYVGRDCLYLRYSWNLKHIELISFLLWRRQGGFLLLTLCGQRVSLPVYLFFLALSVCDEGKRARQFQEAPHPSLPA